MRQHHTKTKGDIGLIKVMEDLTCNKGAGVSLPVSEHLPYDLIADFGGKLYKIQAKYRESGKFKTSTNWSDKNGTHSTKYLTSDLDFFGLYLPDINKVVYIPWGLEDFGIANITIRSTLPKANATPFYWYEDFLELADISSFPTKRKLHEFGDQKPARKSPNRKHTRKVERPSREELSKLIEEHSWVYIGKLYGVSDNAVRKWAKSYGLLK